MKTHILLVEDEAPMARFVQSLLVKRGYGVRAVTSADAALQEILQEVPDLLITDIKLPGLSGFQLCDILKKEPRTAGLPIIMLTALIHEREKVQGLDTGADDYITKPFSEAELLVRVEALLRRVKALSGPAVHTVGEVTIDVDNHEVLVGGKSVKLSLVEFNLLAYLCARKGRVFGHDALLDALWKGKERPTRATLKTHIKRVRAKLGGAGKILQAVKGVGYKASDV